MARSQKELHPKFSRYQKWIVNHPNYLGIPFNEDKSGNPVWLAPAKSTVGAARIDWLDRQRESLSIPKDDGWRAKTALAIHPTKTKPCQVCGNEMSLEYVYPNANLVKSMIKHGFELELNMLQDFREIITLAKQERRKSFFIALGKVFKSDLSVDIPLDELFTNILETGAEKKLLGPGAMSNFPDRLDGFHSYNRCCRGSEDKGRLKANLNRYGQDRRAFENWSDGNWKAADRLMKVFNKYGLSADHIGPISLGFRHDPHFQPMTISEQATKNNRMTYSDVQKLLEHEKFEPVVSWHTKYAWDNLKHQIMDDEDAKEASSILRKNMHFILSVLGYIYANVTYGEDFLSTTILDKQLEYAYADYDFEGFDPETGNYDRMIVTRKQRKEYSNNAARYKRKAFESLENYADKDNRWYTDFLPHYRHELSEIKTLIENKSYKNAFFKVNELFETHAISFCKLPRR
jgi:Alw26I/Eco31I/Esp3I family type II restriction endonuclease